jgi:hypothetical protein
MEGDADRPPFFRSWSGIYFLVIAGLLLQVIVFTLISKAYQ